jgi:hypothetical protein
MGQLPTCRHQRLVERPTQALSPSIVSAGAELSCRDLAETRAIPIAI